MFHITNITHEGKMSEAFNNARRVEELSEKLRSRLSWRFGGVHAIIDDSENKITIRIADKDEMLTVLDEAETTIKELREAINKAEGQA